MTEFKTINDMVTKTKLNKLFCLFLVMGFMLAASPAMAGVVR